MTDFDYDVAQRRALTRGSRYKKNGSKSKKCKLSTDYMSRKNWEGLCGKVMTYQMDRPVEWAEFKRWPKNIQEEYMGNVITKYGASIDAIGKMFGIKTNTLYAHIKTNSIGLPQTRIMPSACRMKFLEACQSGRFPKQEQETEPEIDITPILTLDTDEQETKVDNGPDGMVNEFKPIEQLHMSMHGLSMTFDGNIDVSGIANSLKTILGPHAHGRVTITCELA